MNTFLDLQNQTTFKSASTSNYKSLMSHTRLLKRITERGNVEQAIAILHPTYENAGRRVTRFTKSNRDKLSIY